MILRFLGIQGIAGIAVSLALAILLVVQKGETRHWRKQSAGFEQLYSHEQAAFAGTVANYRASAEQARVADKANADRVAAGQRTINERTANAYETRLAAARARADQLRVQSQAAAHRSPGGSASMPGQSAGAGESAQATNQDRLPGSDALTATEQAIQLDELIKWVRAQAKVDNNPAPVASSPGK
ncbi:MAG: hypothetical protein QOK41_1680 [Sphingomonadales bacterium]|nr:hypothetical protein [Sphingomonadales bacterium]